MFALLAQLAPSWICVTLALSLSLCAAPAPTPSPSPTATVSATATPTPVAGVPTPYPGLYKFGARMKPDPAASPGLDSIAGLESGLGRPLDYGLSYNWITFAFPGAEITDDVANGRTPVISLNCGWYKNADIAFGLHDTAIDTAARALAAVKSPIIIRYLWEMNSSIASNNRQGCTGPNDVGGFFNAPDFIAAWHHLRTRFIADGATNVLWYWCPNDGLNTLAAYYPGDSEVDLVGVDIYDRTPGNISAYNSHFTQIYNAVEGATTVQKPFIVGETGGMQGDQLAYFANQLSLFATAPRLVGWIYFDTVGPLADWRVQPGTPEFSALRALVRTPAQSQVR